MSRPHTEPPVFRNITFPLSVFDYLKDYQRAHVREHGERLSISRVVCRILMEHQQALGATGGHHARGPR